MLKTFEPGRALDDYGTAVIRYSNGALGTVTASQISHGRENDIWIEVDGTKGSLEWHQEEPNKMFVRINGKPHQIYTRDRRPVPRRDGRRRAALPSGHPEAFLEAFANIYTAAYDDMIARASRPEVRRRKQPLSQRRRRRGWHELHHAMRRQLRRKRGVEAVEASACAGAECESANQGRACQLAA